MTKTLTEEDIQKALENYAAEPVHIPGIIQPYGSLVAVDVNSKRIAYASENTGVLMGIPVEELCEHPAALRNIFAKVNYRPFSQASVGKIQGSQFCGAAFTLAPLRCIAFRYSNALT